jgi:hypothetical protein
MNTIVAAAGFAEMSREESDALDLMFFEGMLVLTTIYLLAAIAWIYFTKGRFSDDVTNSTVVMLWLPLIFWFHFCFDAPRWWYPYHDWPIVLSLLLLAGVNLLSKHKSAPSEVPQNSA